MVTFRFTVRDDDGKERQVEWSFEETKNRPGILYTRDAEREAGGRFRREAYFEQEVITIQVPAGVLQMPKHYEKFRQFCRCGSVELLIQRLPKEKWVKYTPDLPNGELEFEFVDDLDPLITVTIKLIEQEPRGVTRW